MHASHCLHCVCFLSLCFSRVDETRVAASPFGVSFIALICGRNER